MIGPIYRLTLRQLLRGRRTIALVALALVPALLAAAWSAGGTDTPTRVYATLMETVLVPTVLALVSLVLGASAIGDERDDGTIVYLTTTPAPRRAIVLAKLLGAWTATVAVCLPGAALCLALSLRGEATVRAAAWAAAAVLGTTLAYTAVFTLLSLAIRRPVVAGFLYILFWEGSIASVAKGASRLSIAAYGRKLVDEGVPGADRFNVPTVTSTTALIVLAVVAVAGWLLAGARLSRVELP